MITKTITFVKKKQPDRMIPMLVQTASRFQSRILFKQAEKTANVKSIMGMLNFTMIPGENIEVSTEGDDEGEAMAQMEEFLTSE
ncbi:MAG: HPr family phosphocarrier protein [Eubacterium sp.]|nr:HPr family phosphocarrier protein [Eubacterium sp.]MBQ7201440.1 HPr family phosphocarrier protein [Eubacterium sp.]MBR0120020.1 HPr family phosphocarrier protein [Eubacterium sp.]